MNDRADRGKRQMSAANRGAQVRIKVRVGEDAVGPGKIRLLELVDSEGGISAAGRQMGLSYRRAWHLINTLNTALGEPVIETSVGGEGGGGAQLTDTGRALVERYREAFAAAEAAMKPFTEWLDDPGGE